MALTKFLSNLVIDGSGGTVLDVQGSVGQLFSVTDSLTGDLFAVSDISGIPILNVNSSGAVDIDGTLNLGDSDKIQLGASQDLQIFHNGSNSYIETSSTSTGDFFVTARGTNHDLYLEAADNIYIRPQGNENGVVVVGNGGVTLYHNNVAKLETYATGAGVTGSLYLASGNYVHFDNGVTNNYAIRKNSTNLEFKTGGGYNFLSGNATFAGNVILNSRLTFDYGGDHYLEAGTDSLSYKSSGGGAVMTLNASTSNATFASNIYAGGDLTVAGGDVYITKQNDAPTLTLLHDGTNPSTNDLLFVMQFQSDFDGTHQNWGKIICDTNNSAVRTNLDFFVKSTSGSEQLGFRIEGQPSETPKGYFYNDVDVDGDLTATNLSGTNTGDQDLSGYSTASGVEDNADVTDATNVAAAGALMKAGGTMTGALVGTTATFIANAAAGTNALNILGVANGLGTGITFSDNGTPAASASGQNGYITYYHGDGSSYGSGNTLIMSSSETTMTILADGKLMYKEGIYSKPSSGTGAGTRKDANWDTAYGWGDHGLSAQDKVDIGNLSGTNTGDQDLSGYAPLASPALTGTPTAPTAGATVNTTQIATTAFVQTAVSNLVDSAPGTLNTLNELAAALGDDASFSTTVTNSIATKLPKAGGTMTGDLIIGTAASAGLTQAFGDFDQLKFDNSHSDSARGPNKIVMHDNGVGGWRGGFGIHSSTVAYYSGDKHIWYKSGASDSYTERMTLDGSGNLSIDGTLSASGYNKSNWDTAYGWGNHASAGYLTSYTETDTLDSVADRGATTNQALTIGSSATGGGRILSQNYSGSNRLGVISSENSSGDLLLGYGAEGKNGSSGFVSTYSNFSGAHSVLQIASSSLDWRVDASNSQTEIGSDLTLASQFSVSRTGVLTMGDSFTSTKGNTAYTYSQVGHLPLAGGTLAGNVAFAAGYTLSVDTTITDQIRVGDRVTLTESTDRTDLLYINSSTDGWGGLQIGNTSNEFIFSLMGNGTIGGIYDDQNSDWLIQWTENAGVSLYFENSDRKLQTISTGVAITGDIKIDSALLSNQENTDVDTGTETVATVAHATYTAAFFDYVIKNGTNVRAGTVYSCHDGTNVEFTETSTVDLGDTSDVTLAVDISGTDMRLRATTTSNDWSVKSLVRAI